MPAPRLGRRPLADPGVAAAVGVGGLALVHWWDPHRPGSYGFCPFLELTGRPCPGCGGLRALHDLTDGHVVAAISSNALVPVLVVVLGVAWVRWVLDRAHGGTSRMIVLTPRLTWCVLAVLLVFGVVRNTPWGSWLAP